MKHAGAEALDRLQALIAALRELPELRERTTGTFYRRSRAFLHFHEDPDGLFADVRLAEQFERIEVTTAPQQQVLLQRVRESLNEG